MQFGSSVPETPQLTVLLLSSSVQRSSGNLLASLPSVQVRTWIWFPGPQLGWSESPTQAPSFTQAPKVFGTVWNIRIGYHVLRKSLCWNKKVDHQKSFELNLGIRRLFAIIQWSNSMQLTVHHRPSTFIVVHHRPSSASTFIELSSNRPLSCNWPSTFIEITVQFGPDSIDLFYKIGRLRRKKIF